MDVTDLYYTAGLIDGEGTITLTVITKGKGRAPVVSVSSTTIELLEYMKQNYGGHIIKVKKRDNNHKDAWHWQVVHDKAISLVSEIEPYLKEPKKKARAKLIKEKYKLVTPRNGKYTDQLLVEKQQFENMFFNL